MDAFNNGFISLTSFNRSPVARSSFNDAGGNNENELNPEMASELKKQLPTKNFMSPTISAANKTSFPKKKILAERNETLDVEKTSLLRSSSLDPKAVKFTVVEADDEVEKDLVDNKSYLQPYDPIKNYLSPRPKFLRYNPDRRRERFGLHENEDGVKSSSSSFDSGITSSGLELRADSSGSCSEKESIEAHDTIDNESEGQLRADSSGSTGSCSQKETVKEAEDMIAKEVEDDEEDETEEDMVEFGEDKGCGLKGFLKFLIVVIALISTTQAICSMNSPTPSSHTLESVWGFNSWSDGAGLKFSAVRLDPKRESDLVVGRLKEIEDYHDYEGLDAVENTEELVEVVSKEVSDLLQELGAPDNEVENVETDVIQDEIRSNQEETDHSQLIEILQEETEVMEIHGLETEREEVPDQDFNQDGVTEEVQSDANESSSQLTIDDVETAKEMEDVVEDINDIQLETTVVLIGLAGFDLIVAVLIGVPILILTFFGVVYRSRWMKTIPSSPVATMVANEIKVTEKEDIKDPEPSPSLIQPVEVELMANFPSLVLHPKPKDVSKEISRVNAPTVELLGEFVFGEEVTSSSIRSNGMKGYNMSVSHQKNKGSLIQATTVSSSQTRSSHMETPTRDYLPVKKQRQKNAEVSRMVTPSPVRRSNRLQNRSAVKFP